MPANACNLLMAFVGDDFTGSTDAMESLARHGIRTVLFTEPPSRETLSRYPGLRAFGIASLTRSLRTDDIAQHIQPAFTAMRDSGAPIVHYKTCSTFDSSPTIGSIGRVIDIGVDTFSSQCVSVLVAAPALGRYCVFGNLFAGLGSAPEVYRLDRHPSMSRHPITPMDEADLRLHLGKQTSKSIGLLDILKLNLPNLELKKEFDTIVAAGKRIVVIDAIDERQLETIGALFSAQAAGVDPLFVVGSSGIESALCGHWMRNGIATDSAAFLPVKDAGPIVAICGSCSPVTGTQIEWAVANGFVEIAVDPSEMLDVFEQTVNRAIAAIRAGSSVCIHTRGTQNTDARSQNSMRSFPQLGSTIGKMLLAILAETSVKRVLIAGGDTSSQIARALQIEAVEMCGELTRGSPLCKASSSNSLTDGLEITFKGGQIGRPDFFGLVRHGYNSQQIRLSSETTHV